MATLLAYFVPLDVSGEGEPVQVALVSLNARVGDAIGNQLLEKWRFFRQQGAEVRVFVESTEQLHPLLKPYTHQVTDSHCDSARTYFNTCEFIFFEFGQYYSLLDWLPLLQHASARIIVDYHGITPPELWGTHNREQLLLGQSKRGLMWFADRVLVHSQFTFRELVEECQFPKERVKQIGFPLAGTVCPSGKSNPKRKLGIESARMLLFVGRLAVNKNVPFLVRVLHHLRDMSPPVHLVMIGDNKDLYREQAEECQRLAREWNIADRLHILGHQPDEVLYNAYRCADVFVTASLSEGFCIPVTEAMSAGLPVVSSDCGALPETVGDAGLICPVTKVSPFAEAVRTVLENSSVAENLRQRGRSRTQEFSQDKWELRFRQIVTETDMSERPFAQPRLRVRSPIKRKSVKSGETAIPVRIKNLGNLPMLPDADRCLLRYEIEEKSGGECINRGTAGILRRMLLPGQTHALQITIPVPATIGDYRIRLSIRDSELTQPHWGCRVTLRVQSEKAKEPPCQDMLGQARSHLSQAEQRQQLPDDYLDVTQGMLARVKHRIKQKLLYNFKTGYVDVLSRQQSEFNQNLLAAVQELAECCTVLDQAVRQLKKSQSH